MHMGERCNILSLTPYRVLPPTNGGHLGIVSMHEYLGRICQDHVIGTTNNGNDKDYAFQLHRAYPAHALRYLPLYNISRIAGIGRRYDVNYIFCDHPYLALSAIALSKKLGIPWFLRSHNIESERFRSLGKKWWRLLRTYERMAMKQADGVFFITPEDRQWAENNFLLDPAVCHLIPYGAITDRIPEGHEAAKATLAHHFHLDAGKVWIYFLGAMNYLPNIEAIKNILHEVVPRLERLGKNSYQILIAGKGLPESLQQTIAVTSNITYLGFLPEVDTFLKACDIMVNPMLTGGGIKTKAVEALGYNKTVISTAYGAAGIIPEICGDNLHIADNHDWDAFTEKLVMVMSAPPPMIPTSFYDTYYWGNIAQKVVRIMQQTSRQSPAKA